MMPYLSSYVDIELIGKYKDREFYNRKFWYQIGEGEPLYVTQLNLTLLKLQKALVQSFSTFFAGGS